MIDYKNREEEKIRNILKEIFLIIVSKSKEEYNYNNGLMGGDYGSVIFLFYYSRYTHEKKHKTAAECLLNNLLNNIENQQSGYCNGLSGILYLLEFLKNEKFVEIDLSDSQMRINKFLYEKSIDNINSGSNEFLHGSLGVNCYFLKKDHQSFINSYVDHLYDSAQKTNNKNTYCWIMGLEKFHHKTRSDISLSHGMSGLILFLVRIIQQGNTNPKIKEMIEKGIQFILLQELNPDKYGSSFPSFALEDKETPQKSRLAWCYGDLGVSLALWHAGHVLKNTAWNIKALEILHYSTKRILPDDTYITDAGICHGSGGIAMIFNRMYLNTGIPEYLTATEYWIKETLRFLEEKKEPLSNNDYSLLTGFSGIGLVLLSYLSKDSQSWDELFLLSY